MVCHPLMSLRAASVFLDKLQLTSEKSHQTAILYYTLNISHMHAI